MSAMRIIVNQVPGIPVFYEAIEIHRTALMKIPAKEFPIVSTETNFFNHQFYTFFYVEGRYGWDVEVANLFRQANLKLSMSKYGQYFLRGIYTFDELAGTMRVHKIKCLIKAHFGNIGWVKDEDFLGYE